VQPALITVLADTAVRAADLDEAKAVEAKRHAEELLQNHTSDVGLAAAEAELAQAVAQLAAIKRLRPR
jgi:F-type H+-transporting ATPase subunit epsilon